MKNKIAERAKRKRRQEKRAAEAAFAKELTEGVKQRAKEHGIKNPDGSSKLTSYVYISRLSVKQYLTPFVTI